MDKNTEIPTETADSDLKDEVTNENKLKPYTRPTLEPLGSISSATNVIILIS